MIKKLFTSILILMISNLAVMARTVDDEKIAFHKTIPPIEDELIKSQNFPKVFPEFIKDNSPIIDELMESVNSSKHTIKLFVRKNVERNNAIIEDELITPAFKSKVGAVSVLKLKQRNVIEDNFIKNNKRMGDKRYTKAKTNYDFSKKQIPVQLKIVKNITTKRNMTEGDSVLFQTVKDVTVNNVYLPKGTYITGRVETVSSSDKMGTPANVIIDNFHVKGNPDICFYGNITKTGANRSLWVYPLYQAGNIIFYVAGFVFVPIHGGHAKLSTKEIYTVFYETN